VPCQCAGTRLLERILQRLIVLDWYIGHVVQLLQTLAADETGTALRRVAVARENPLPTWRSSRSCAGSGRSRAGGRCVSLQPAIEPSPLSLDFALELFPLTFENILIHTASSRDDTRPCRREVQDLNPPFARAVSASSIRHACVPKSCVQNSELLVRFSGEHPADPRGSRQHNTLTALTRSSHAMPAQETDHGEEVQQQGPE
jgi:hypothetical protein